MAWHTQHRDQTTDKASTTTLKTLKQKGSNRNTCKEINLSKLLINSKFTQLTLEEQTTTLKNNLMPWQNLKKCSSHIFCVCRRKMMGSVLLHQRVYNFQGMTISDQCMSIQNLFWEAAFDPVTSSHVGETFCTTKEL